MKVFKITDPIYYTDLYIMVGDSEEAENYILRKHGCKVEIKGMLHYMETFNIISDDGVWINYLWMSEWANNTDNICALGHEMVHVMCSSFERVGIKIDNKNSEPAAYYFDLMFGEALIKLAEFGWGNKKAKKKCRKKKHT